MRIPRVPPGARTPDPPCSAGSGEETARRRKPARVRFDATDRAFLAGLCDEPAGEPTGDPDCAPPGYRFEEDILGLADGPRHEDGRPLLTGPGILLTDT